MIINDRLDTYMINIIIYLHLLTKFQNDHHLLKMFGRKLTKIRRGEFCSKSSKAYNKHHSKCECLSTPKLNQLKSGKLKNF